MLSTVIAFALLTALFEAILLLKLSSEEKLRQPWFRNGVHLTAIVANLAIHWGTIVGTMTAVTAGLVSFATVPVVIAIFSFKRNWNATH